MKNSVQPPKHLSAPRKAWFNEVVSEWKLDTHHILVLTAACEALDRAEEARQAVAKSGAYVTNRFGEVRKHPGIAVQRDAMIAFARLLREMDLDIDGPPDASRPPALRRKN